MNYSEIIKKELDKYSENEIIFASKLYKEKLYKHNVSEASFYKFLERMHKNNEIKKLSKGIYYFPKASKYGDIPISDEKIISIFTSKNEGMVVGHALYNQLNLSTQIPKNIKIYSSRVDNEVKKIRNVEIKNVKIKYSKEYIKIIQMLEVLQNFYEIQDINYKEFYNFAKEFSQDYDEEKTNYVLKTINYKKSTISSLENVLNHFNVKNNMNRHLSSLSKYKNIAMEEIYELAQAQERF